LRRRHREQSHYRGQRRHHSPVDTDNVGQIQVNAPPTAPVNDVHVTVRGNAVALGQKVWVEAGPACVAVNYHGTVSTQDCSVVVTKGGVVTYALSSLAVTWPTITLSNEPKVNAGGLDPGQSGQLFALRRDEHVVVAGGQYILSFDILPGTREVPVPAGQDVAIDLGYLQSTLTFVVADRTLPDASQTSTVQLTLANDQHESTVSLGQGTVTVSGFVNPVRPYVHIALGQQTLDLQLLPGANQLRLGRVDVQPVAVTDPSGVVNDVSGLYTLSGPETIGGSPFTRLYTAVPTGVGLNVLLGDYSVDLSYKVRDLPKTQSFELSFK
jgi:hypothetical protein